MAHLKDLVVNGNSRTLGTSYATNYSGKWEGISNDINTENTSDTWVPVLTNGVLQHRVIPAAYNNDPSTLSVNYAKTSGTANNVAWGGVTGKPATYTPSAHTHAISDISNLQNTINSINSNKADLNYLNDNFYSVSSIDNKVNTINSNKADLKYLNDNFYSVSSIDNKVNTINSAIGGKYSSNGGTLNGDLSFPSIGDTDSSKGIVWGGSTDGAKIYYKTAAADKGQLVLHMDDDSDTTINFEWNISGNVGTKSYITSDGVYHGKATNASYADSAGSANSVAWGNVSGKPSITYYGDESNLPSEYTGANVWKSPS